MVRIVVSITDVWNKVKQNLDLSKLSADVVNVIKSSTDTIDWSDITSIAGDVTSILADTATIAWSDISTIISNIASLDSAITVIDGIVDAILVDTAVINWANISTIISNLAIVDTVVDLIKVDTTATVSSSAAAKTAAEDVQDKVNNAVISDTSTGAFGSPTQPDPSGTASKLSEHWLPKIKTILATIDKVVTIPTLNLSFGSGWGWLADGLEKVVNSGVAPMYEKLTDTVFGVVEWSFKALALITDDLFTSLQSWWYSFVNEYFFIAHTVKLDTLLKLGNTIFGVIEGDYQLPFTKMKLNLDLGSLPATALFNIWLPKFLLTEIINDPTQTNFGQTSVRIWHVMMDLLGVLAVLVGVVIAPRYASKLMKLILGIRKLRGKSQHTSVIPSRPVSRMLMTRNHLRNLENRNLRSLIGLRLSL